MIQKPKVSKNRMISDIKNSKDPLTRQKNSAQAELTATQFDETYVQQVDEYNATLKALDPKFANLIPINQVLVRCYLNKPYISPEGVIQPFPVMVTIPTAMGPKATMVENDYNYDFKAVVVARPPSFSQLLPGQTVIIKESAVRPQVVGDVKNGYFQVMPTAFNYPNGVPMVGTKFGDRDFGYILVNYQDLVAILPDVE